MSLWSLYWHQTSWGSYL